MKIMISQPMSGKTEKQIKEEREAIIALIEKEGNEYLDTVLDISEGLSPIYYLGESIKKMSEADGVIFMSGWESARGCIIEYNVAKMYGKYIREV